MSTFPAPTAVSVNTEQASLMAAHGITCIPINYFHYRQFRYTNLDDAVAQAQRSELLAAK
jgi:hypothetical protein